MSLDLEDADRETLGYGDIFWAQMPLTRSTVGRSKVPKKAVVPKLRCLDVLLYVEVVRAEQARRYKERKAKNRNRKARDRRYYLAHKEKHRKYKQARREHINRQRREKYAADPEYRTKCKQLAKIYRSA